MGVMTAAVRSGWGECLPGGAAAGDAVPARAVVKAPVSQALPGPSSTWRLLWCRKWEKGRALVSALQLLEWPHCTCSLGSVEVDGLRPHPPFTGQMERWAPTQKR